MPAMLGGVMSGVLAACLSLAAVNAAPPDSAAADAEASFKAGELKYSTSDYAGAIEDFTLAYEAARGIEDEALRKAVVKSMLFNLARAHRKEFDLDDQRRHLKLARDLFQKYLKMEGELADELEADQYVAEINKLLGEDGPRSVVAEGPVAEPNEHPDKPDKPAREPANGILIGGIAAASLSAVGIGLLIAGSVGGQRAIKDYENAESDQERTEADDRGRKMNGLSIGGGIAAAVLAGTGVALIVIGKKRDKARTSLVPVGPGRAGFTITTRF